MTSTPSSRNRLNKQGTGDNRNTWGTKLNSEVFDLVDESLDGVETIALSGSKVLTATNYVSDEARNRGLKFTDDGLSSAPTVTLPSNEKLYWIINDTGYSITFDAGGTTGVVETGRRKWISVDASNNVDVGEDGADKEYVDTTFLPLMGGTLTGALTLSGAPTVALHAATKAYADTMLPLAGGTMTGFIVLHTETPTDDLHPASKGYVDELAFNAVDLPGQSGNAGKYLTTDGTNASWGTISVAFADLTGKPTTLGGYGITDGQPLDATLTALAGLTTANGNIIYATGVDTFSQVTSTTRGRNELTRPSPAHINNTDSPYSASFGEEIFVDCSTGAVEIDLPAATAGSLPILITDDDGSSVTNNITIDPNGAETIAGQSTIEIDQARASILLVPFAGSWRIAN